MIFIRSILYPLIAFNVFAVSAFATDLPKKKMPPMVPFVHEQSDKWVGPYIGIVSGIGSGRHSSNSVAIDDLSQNILTVLPVGATIGSSGSTIGDQLNRKLSSSGAVFGLQFGYNWLYTDKVIIGIEGDISKSMVQSDASNSMYVLGDSRDHIINNESIRLNSFETLIGRIGYEINPSILVFATGGIAYGSFKSTSSISLDPPINSNVSITGTDGVHDFLCEAGFLSPTPTAVCYGGSDNSNKFGWALGAGTEYRLTDSISAKLEYLHLGFGNQSLTMISPPPSGGGIEIQKKYSHLGYDLISLAVVYKFNL